jgi:ATP synthase, Delta/Epsilon chain, beta-sandwich domain
MMSRRSLTLIARHHGLQARFLATDAAPAASGVKLNFSLPYEKIYDGVTVHSVILPGAAGEYGVTANHVPYVAQLKPGVFQIFQEETTQEPEKYFVAGGYALTHDDSSTVSYSSLLVIVVENSCVELTISHGINLTCIIRTWSAPKPSNWMPLIPPP